MVVALSRLELVEIPRDVPGGVADRARGVPRLRGPLTQLDVHVDGVSLLELAAALDPAGLWTRQRFVSVADVASPAYSAEQLRWLGGWQARDRFWQALEAGRLPLYVCSQCGDLYCGSMTVAVERVVDPDLGIEVVRWGGLRFDDGQDEDGEHPDLTELGPFVFDAQQHDLVLRDAVARLESQANEDDQQQQQWRNGRWRLLRLLRGRGRAPSARNTES